ncbi:MAG: branched-chain-amino-acid transaminase [Spirochaetota bacterium]
MAAGFTLSIYPWVYTAKYTEDKSWHENYIEKPHKTPKEESSLTETDFKALLKQRNSFPELPLVNYTTQYGLGCFEGLKAFPQPGGSLKLFRPDENARRMANSMRGLYMPVFPEGKFVEAVKKVVKSNQDLGFYPTYDPAWAKEDFTTGHSVYIRPFTYSEPAIGLGLSSFPWVVIITTPVGSYFRPGNSKAVTTDKVRAFRGGTGWIKCDANYVMAILAKKEAEASGYMEAIFLDAEQHEYVEEGSSCNIFFYLKNGVLVTPSLEDTILSGVSRKSVITLARDMSVKTEERRISIHEVLAEAGEVFVTGTAAGITSIESITHKDRTVQFSNGKMGDLTRTLLKKLKGIQYGAEKDTHAWMYTV